MSEFVLAMAMIAAAQIIGWSIGLAWWYLLIYRKWRR